VLVDLWQLSQLPVTLAWGVFDGLPTAGGKPPVWQVAQLLLTLTLAWNLAGVQVPKPDLWQLSQLAEATGGTDWYGMWWRCGHRRADSRRCGRTRTWPSPPPGCG
jgi:hypothetical protein